MRYIENPGDTENAGAGVYVLSTGKRIEAFFPELRISKDDAGTGSQDMELGFPEDLTDAERAEIADYAIDLWRQWRHQK